MATIVCKLHLGLRNQQIFIQGQKYSKKETIENYSVPTEKLSSFIATAEGVSEAVLEGPVDYLKKIKEDTQKEEMARYSKVKTKFTFI